ncbi:lectin-like domain-containing protein [Streptomyces canus]|uniref:lectin-like domain-containing protein n=1 Tax=Streptomyces canus TaxID=58343 RepID=UPI00039A613A|nr:hypothetical protein [Streptomyces canus]
MPLPAGVELVTVRSAQPLTLPDGTWIQGTLTFTGPDLVTIGGQDVVLGGGVKVQLADGQFSVPLVATDATGMSPTGWTYKVVANFTNAPSWTRYISLPKATPSVALADVLVPDPVAGTYTVLAVPRGGVTLATSGAPASGLGIDGDWALDTGTRRLYGPKAAGAWPAFSVIPAPTATGWVRNGFAVLSGTDLYLTHAADGFGAGSSWYGTAQPTDGLDVTFDVEMSGGTGADGVTFALAAPATAATFVGAGGGDLGLTGCTAVALALDTGGGSRARIVTTTATAMTTVATYGGALTLRPAPVSVRVRYASGALSAWVGGTQIFNAVAVAATSTALVGWTGSNGGSNDNHIVRNTSFVARGGIQL